MITSENYFFHLRVRAWLLSVEFTLLFGNVFSKTGRVHVMFIDIRRNKTIIFSFPSLTFVIPAEHTSNEISYSYCASTSKSVTADLNTRPGS